MFFRKKSRFLSCFLVLALVISGFGISVSFGENYASAAIRLSKKRVTVKVGKKVRLKLRGARAKAVKWKTANKRIAIVGKRGVIRGKKAGKTKVFAIYRGKKYRCVVTVKAAGSSSSSANGTATPNVTAASGSSASSTASPKATGAASVTSSPKSTAQTTSAPKQTAPAGTGGEVSFDTTPTPKATESGGGEVIIDTTPDPVVPEETKVPSDEGESSLETPTSAAENTLQLGSVTEGKSVTLGASASTLSSTLGTPVRIDKAVQGFDLYIYNPSGDYNNYFQVYVENGVVCGFVTISSYFAFDSYVKSNDTTDTLSKNGFTAETSSKSSRGYRKSISANGQSYEVVAYIDRYGGSLRDTATKQVFGLQVYPSSYDNDTMFQDGSPYGSTCTSSDGVYVNEGANNELCELINAYRVFKGKSPYRVGLVVENVAINDMDYYMVKTNFAQTIAAEMATANSETVETVEEKKERFEDNTYFTVGKYGEIDTVKSADPMDALKTFLFGSLESTDTAEKILSDEYGCILCGFGYKSSTFFVVDFWY